MVNICINNVLSVLYPASCLLCGDKGEDDRDLCLACTLDLPVNPHCCRQCALPLPPGTRHQSLCGRCLKNKPSFDLTIAPYLYKPPIQQLIGDFKFNSRLSIGRLLSQLMIQHMKSHLSIIPDTIIPVPLHHSRIRERGFNQALELSRPIAKHFHIPIHSRAIKRSRATTTQTQLKRKKRRKNVRGAFQLQGTKLPKRIALIDDVMTTGSTLSEISKLLKKAGVEHIQLWLVARTP